MSAECPTCGHELTDEITVAVVKDGDKFSVSARQGIYVGWALRSSEEEARKKALLRLRAAREGWFV